MLTSPREERRKQLHSSTKRSLGQVFTRIRCHPRGDIKMYPRIIDKLFQKKCCRNSSTPLRIADITNISVSTLDVLEVFIPKWQGPDWIPYCHTNMTKFFLDFFILSKKCYRSLAQCHH